MVAVKPSLPKNTVIKLSKYEINMVEPLTKLGAVVVAVERILVPKSSEAVLIKTAQ